MRTAPPGRMLTKMGDRAAFAEDGEEAIGKPYLIREMSAALEEIGNR